LNYKSLNITKHLKHSGILFLIFLSVACDELLIIDLPTDKTATADSTKTNNNNNNTGTQTNGNGQTPATPPCNLIQYSDSLFYIISDKEDVKIKPLVERKGEYGAYPTGMEINESNGEINLTKSETGLRYQVYFIPKNTSDTCFTYVTISGVDYLSDIYDLSKNKKLAVPIYNNNPLLPIPGIGKTEFDDGPDDDDNDGTLDEPLPGQEVIPQGLAISKIDGKISLDVTVANGVFGKTPKNGDSKKFKIYYRIDDNSKKSLNRIEIEVYYYDSGADVPKDLKDKIEDNKRSQYLENVGLRYARIFRLPRKPRPPKIVIVGRT